MSDNFFNEKLIEKCTVDFLPNEVLFALGDSEKARCASEWIKSLTEQVKMLEESLGFYANGEVLDDIYETKEEDEEIFRIGKRARAALEALKGMRE